MNGADRVRHRPRLHRRAGVILAVVALLAIAVVVDPRPGRSRGFRFQAHSHDTSVVRTIAPYLGAIGESLLQRDCGKCHAQSTASLLPAPKAASKPIAPHAGIDMVKDAKSCVRCHDASVRGA